DQAGFAHQRYMGRDHDIVAGDRMSICLDAKWLVPEFAYFSFLEDVAASTRNAWEKPGQVLKWVELGLIGEANSSPSHQRDRFLEGGIEAQFLGQPGVFL